MSAIHKCIVAMGKKKPYIVMIFVQFVYAGMALISKAAISEGTFYSIFVAYRQGLAAIALAPFAFFLERNNSATLSLNLLCKIFLITFGITLSLNLHYLSLNYISATFTTALGNTIPAMVFILAVSLRMESLSLRQWHGIAKMLGAVLALSGAMVFSFFKGPPIYSGTKLAVVDVSAKSNISKEDWVKGGLLLLGACFSWATWLIIQGPIMKQYPAKLRLITLQCFFSCIQTTIWGVAMERHLSSWKLGWNISLVGVAYCGLIVTGITYSLQVWVVAKKGPVFTAIFSPLALVLTAIFSAIIFKETFHWGSACGAVLLVGGLYCYLWGKNKESQDQKSETKEEHIVEIN